MLGPIVIIIIAWNVIVLALYGIDKLKAVKGKWRISESALILCAFLAGSVGAFLGMILFRHKTRNMKFKILVPLALVLHIVAIGFLTNQI